MARTPNKSLDDFARTKLAALEAQALRRRLVETDRREGAIAFRDGRRLVSFCCNDYLNLSQNEAVKRAAIEATEKYGTGSGASRLVSGNHPLFRELEIRLAEWKQAEDCVVFGSGYMANLGIIPSLTREGDLIVADELSHACLLSGSKLSGARVEIFRHNDMAHLEAQLVAHRVDQRVKPRRAAETQTLGLVAVRTGRTEAVDRFYPAVKIVDVKNVQCAASHPGPGAKCQKHR